LSVKSTSKLVSWLGKFFTPTRTLVKSVLSAQPAYYLSTLNALSEVIEEINIRHKHFTWTKHTNLREESAKWHGLRSACPPNTAGWHKKYARALRLHWLWMEWKDPQKPWVDMPISCNVGDRRLFTGTTTITVGGKGVAKNSWLQQSTISPKRKLRSPAGGIHSTMVETQLFGIQLSMANIRQLWLMRLNSKAYKSQPWNT
jgi:hypothetical protein